MKQSVSNSPRPRIVVHLGLPKTGSTTVQQMLRENEKLLGRVGIKVWPRSSETEFMRKSAVSYVRRRTAWRRLKLLAATWFVTQRIRTSQFSALIISDENLIGTESAGLFSNDTRFEYQEITSRFDSELAGYDVRYVIFLREREKWQRSGYNQTAKKLKHHESFEQWATKNGALDGPDRIVQQLQRKLGERLTVVDMASELTEGRFLGRSLLEAAGVPPAELDAIRVPRPRNESLPNSALKFIGLLGREGISGRRQRKIARVVRENGHLFAPDRGSE